MWTGTVMFEAFKPRTVMEEYLRQANARFGDFGEDADEARRLYTAHRLTMRTAGTVIPVRHGGVPCRLSPRYAGACTELRVERGELRVGPAEVSTGPSAGPRWNGCTKSCPNSPVDNQC